MATELDKNKDLIRRWIEFSNTGFAGSVADFISAEYIGHLGATRMGRNELERLERQFSVAFPDAHHTIDDLIAEGDQWCFAQRRARHTEVVSRASIQPAVL